ncbi:hypothetical protein MMC29_008349 [Sticta canariensis]|nr:hypothetical protein [Sticta canariensis]
MNQKQMQNPVANGRPVASMDSPRGPSLLPKIAPSSLSPLSGASPPAQIIQKSTPKSAPLSVGARTIESRKEIATPVKTFLNSNITPRSSSRKARKESASSTPNSTPHGTPASSRPVSMIDQRERGAEDHDGNTALGIGYVGAGRADRASSVVSDGPSNAQSCRPTSWDRNLYRGAKTTSPESRPMFFRADDVRPILASIPSERYFLQDKAPGSIGLEGDYELTTSSLSISPPLEEHRPKFFYANDAAESKTSLPNLATGSIRSPTIGPQSQRATSPLKDEIPLEDEILPRKSSLSKPSPRRRTRLASNPTTSRQEIRLQEPPSTNQSSLSRSSSLSTPDPRRLSYGKSCSVSNVASIRAGRPSIALSDGPTLSPKIHPVIEPQPPSYARPPSPVKAEPPNPQSPINLTSPTPGQNKLEHMNELAANARRERKVLDLEISNSSLLAINRTLEREMRKQNAEIRRYRRLGRSGRLSITPSSRSASKTLSMLSEKDYIADSDDNSGQLSPALSVEESEDDAENLSDHSSCSNTSLARDNPSSSHAGRLRVSDSKRLHLEFSRHRALLIDSQKLNESLQRCIGRTEDLITDGKKALAYRVDVHGAEKCGGRVLLPDEIEDRGVMVQGQGLLSPGIRELGEMDWDGPGDVENEVEDEKMGNEITHYAEEVSKQETNTAKSYRAVATDAEIEAKNEWDRIKEDVKTPDEIPGGVGMQGLRDYLLSASKAWRT